MSSLWQRFNDGLAGVAEGAGRSLVQVSSGRRGAGAGIIWDTAGLIVTNAHVVRRHSPRVILADGREFPARLLGYDKFNDLAALAINPGTGDNGTGLPAVTPGDSRALRSGEIVLALGHPWGITGSATAGIVVAVGRGMPDQPGGERELISVGLHLRPGYSGGPLLDAAGHVVGVNVMMAGPEVGLAIPAHVVEAFLKAIAEAGPQETAKPEVEGSPVYW
jgi:S1-C subfamily serine protease